MWGDIVILTGKINTAEMHATIYCSQYFPCRMIQERDIVSRLTANDEQSLKFLKDYPIVA